MKQRSTLLSFIEDATTKSPDTMLNQKVGL